MKAGNSKFGMAQLLVKLAQAKQECGHFGLQQPQGIAVNGRIWVVSGGLQTHWLAKQHMNCVCRGVGLTSEPVCTQPAQSRPVGITCWAGRRNHPSYGFMKEVGASHGRSFSYFSEVLLGLDQSLFTSKTRQF